MKIAAFNPWLRRYSVRLFRLARATWFGPLCLLTACGGADPPDAAGAVALALRAPSDVGSVLLRFDGPTRDVDRCVPVDDESTTNIDALPTGSLLISASAFPGRSCAGTATWLADSQTVVLIAGEITPVHLVFHPNGLAAIDAQFVSDRPSSCAELKLVVPEATDGSYSLFLENDGARPYPAYCADMATVPLTYLTLIQGGNRNVSGYDATRVGTSTVVTEWQRVRFDPSVPAIDPSDFRFSHSTGFVTHEDTTQVPYGVARDCAVTGTPLGIANVDLRGLPFATAPNWSLGGFLPLGTTSVSAFNQVVDITGGGQCGWNAPGGDRLGGVPIPVVFCPAPSDEQCDGVDNDCDGVIDEGCP